MPQFWGVHQADRSQPDPWGGHGFGARGARSCWESGRQSLGMEGRVCWGLWFLRRVLGHFRLHSALCLGFPCVLVSLVSCTSRVLVLPALQCSSSSCCRCI